VTGSGAKNTKKQKNPQQATRARVGPFVATCPTPPTLAPAGIPQGTHNRVKNSPGRSAGHTAVASTIVPRGTLAMAAQNLGGNKGVGHEWKMAGLAGKKKGGG